MSPKLGGRWSRPLTPSVTGEAYIPRLRPDASSTYPRISAAYTRELQARCYSLALAKGYHDDSVGSLCCVTPIQDLMTDP